MGILYGSNHNNCFIANGMWHKGGKNFKSSRKKKQVRKVYIEEQGEYTPYLVLSSNYDGKVLLLREQVLPELMPYKEHSPLWGQDEYGSYYEQSSVNAYLNQEFLDSLAEPVRGYIADTSIEVTDLTAYISMTNMTVWQNRLM